MISTLALFSLLSMVTSADTTTRVPSVRAVPRSGEIVIDGKLDEAIWSGAPAINTLLQSSPDEGAPATEAIEVRFAVDDAAIYVAARLFDRSPDSVMALRTRRDRDSQSDFFEVLLDPLRDLRTGYFFSVSAAGVQGDGVLQNDHFRGARPAHALGEHSCQLVFLADAVAGTLRATAHLEWTLHRRA